MHTLDKSTLNRLVELYLSKIHSDILDLRYRAGKWHVRVPLGNMMKTVSDSRRTNAEDALMTCLMKWEETRCTP